MRHQGVLSTQQGRAFFLARSAYAPPQRAKRTSGTPVAARGPSAERNEFSLTATRHLLVVVSSSRPLGRASFRCAQAGPKACPTHRRPSRQRRDRSCFWLIAICYLLIAFDGQIIESHPCVEAESQKPASPQGPGTLACRGGQRRERKPAAPRVQTKSIRIRVLCHSRLLWLRSTER